jgi:hypothetical protein
MKVPEPPTESGRDGAGLGEALAGLLEFTGATAGWVALAGTDGRLTFPARRGAVPDAPPAAAARPAAAWLALVLQPGGAVAWWDARWEGLTGLAADDLRAVPCETVLDRLPPR